MKTSHWRIDIPFFAVILKHFIDISNLRLAETGFCQNLKEKRLDKLAQILKNRRQLLSERLLSF